MNSREYRELQEAYFDVYEIDEAKVDKVVDKTLEQHGIDPDTRMLVKKGSRKRSKTSESPRRTNTQVKLAHLRSRYDDEIDEAMMPGPRKARMVKKQHDERATPRDRATAFNVGVRDDRPRDKKSTGGKGERYSDFGDRGAGNAARRKQGLQPLRGDTRPTQAEEVDLYDVILSHLLDEGYADTLEAAEGIMVSMSEDWREEILDEARQHPIMSVKSPSGEARSKIRKGSSVPSDYHEHETSAQTSSRRFSQFLRGEKKKKEDDMNAGRLTVATKRGIEAATNRSDDNPIRRNEFAPDSAGKRIERDDQPTDYHARKRRASGR